MSVFPFAYLMIWEDQSISDDHVLSPSCIEDNDLCNIVRRERLAPFVDSIRLLFITVKPYDREFLPVCQPPHAPST